MVEQGNCDAERWLKLVRQAQAALEKTRRPSDRNALELEIATLIEEIKVFPGISELDIRLLRELAQPAILEGALTESLTTRWSNGDFCGRNLLLDAQGGMRLIDYEFAAPTHFSSSDWRRLTSYSILPKPLDENSIPEMQPAQAPWSEIWFWLHHLAQLRNAEPSAIVDQHLAESVSRLFTALGRSANRRPTAGQTSLLINLLSNRENDTRSLLNERMAWVRTVEAEQTFLKANFARLTKEFAERTAWAESVDTELKSTQKSFVRVSEEVAEQQRLVLELTKIKDACAALAPILNAEAGTDERSLLHQCVLVLMDRQRELAATQAEIRSATGSALDERLRAEMAEAEINRLKSALTDAQVHVDRLLTQTTSLALQLNAMAATERTNAATLEQREKSLAAALAELQAIHVTVSDYQRSWLCRLAARISGSALPPSSTS